MKEVERYGTQLMFSGLLNYLSLRESMYYSSAILDIRRFPEHSTPFVMEKEVTTMMGMMMFVIQVREVNVYSAHIRHLKIALALVALLCLC